MSLIHKNAGKVQSAHSLMSTKGWSCACVGVLMFMIFLFVCGNCSHFSFSALTTSRKQGKTRGKFQLRCLRLKDFSSPFWQSMMKAFCNYAQDLWLLWLDFYSSLKVIRREEKKSLFYNQSITCWCVLNA